MYSARPANSSHMLEGRMLLGLLHTGAADHPALPPQLRAWLLLLACAGDVSADADVRAACG
jgi:hypothetical protein